MPLNYDDYVVEPFPLPEFGPVVPHWHCPECWGAEFIFTSLTMVCANEKCSRGNLQRER